jgi:plastocyanin
MLALRLTAALVAFCTIVSCGNDSTTGSSVNPPPPTADPNTDINITVGASTKTTAAFTPNPKNASLAGGGSVTVRWINGDISGGDYTMGTATVHNITSDNGAFPSSGNLNGNATFSTTLSAAGDYPYHCAIHPNMVGTVHVTP